MGFLNKLLGAAIAGRAAGQEVDQIATEIIDLEFGDDGSYHGVQGSQIIRACWLSIFLEIDPESHNIRHRDTGEDEIEPILKACPLLHKFAMANDGFRSQFFGIVKFTHPWSESLMDHAEIPVEDMTRRLRWLGAKAGMRQAAIAEGHDLLRVLRKYTR